MNICKCFEPQIDKNSEILILGSMPGEKSLQMQQYYAHPQNRFWKLMGLLCYRTDLYNLSYSRRIKILLKNNFSLWDVISNCNREGSLDSNIKNEIPNDIRNLLYKYPNIKKICFNGNKAYESFRKYFHEFLEQDNRQYIKLPSTSPANAKYSLENLSKIWTEEIYKK